MLRKLTVLSVMILSSVSWAIFPNNPTAAFSAVGMCGDWNGTAFTQWGSGLAVAPGWILTARHVGGTHFFVNGTYYTVLQKFHHVGTNNADLSLWKMAAPVPTWMPISYPTFGALQGQVATLVGWGNTCTQGVNGWTWLANTFGIKRQSSNVIDAYLPNTFVNFGSFTRTTDYIQYDLDDPSGANTTNTFGGSAISGEGGISDKDSGCPWFVVENGVSKVVAVSSIIGYNTGTGLTSPYQYGGWGAGTFLSNYKAWIQSTAPELGTMTAVATQIYPEGSLISGGLGQIGSADGTTVRVRSLNLYDQDYDQPLGLRVAFTTQVVFPTTLDITVTARTLGGGARGRIWLRNWTTGVFDLVDSYVLGSTLGLRDVSVSSANRVRPSDGRIEVRTSHDGFAVDAEFIDGEFDMIRVVAKT